MRWQANGRGGIIRSSLERQIMQEQPELHLSDRHLLMNRSTIDGNGAIGMNADDGFKGLS